MRIFKSVAHAIVAVSLMAGTSAVAFAADSVKLEGTRFTMEVPKGWNPGYKDSDKLLMLYFKDPASGAALEGVYQRGEQAATFTLEDFKKARIGSEDKRYEGKGHKVVKEADATIAGAKGVYLNTTWADDGKDMEKHTTLYLSNGNRYLVVMSGKKGAVDKAMFDHAVETFALVPETK